MPARRRTLAPPGSNEQIQYLPAVGAGAESVHIGDVHAVRFEAAEPILSESAYKGQRRFSGEWWCTTTANHIPFRSWVHRDFLIYADYCASVIGISARPFMFWFDSAHSGRRCHSPDFFLRLRDGQAVVIDVQSTKSVQAGPEEVFAATAELCRLVGWTYIRTGEQPRIQSANLRWLAGYSRSHSRRGDIATEISAHLHQVHQSTIGALAEEIGDPVIVLPTLYHLMWHQLVGVDPFKQLLTLKTPIEAVEDAT
ncbi:TnsA-like heteromeric transposase endonuclease subunit [Mycobacteroides abscessus]